MKERQIKMPLLLWSLAALLALGALWLAPRTAEAPDTPVSKADTVGEVRLEENSELIQTLTYTRCEHSVKRRLTAPPELYGKNLQQVEALYPEWRITAFSAKEVSMEKQPDLYCPDHLVIMPNGAGYVCVYENKYGDALMLSRETELKLDSLPAAAREEVEHGLGFSTAEEVEMWLESVES